MNPTIMNIGIAILAVFVSFSGIVSSIITYFGAYRPFFNKELDGSDVALLVCIFGTITGLITVAILPVSIFTGERKPGE